MEKELIEKKRQEFIEVKRLQKYLRDSILELEQLKENPYVERYIELLKLDTDKNRKIIEKSEDELLGDVIYGICNVNRTNKIYFYLGTYKYSLECDIVHGSNDVLVKRDDPMADYRAYMNIEDEFDCLHLSIGNSEIFEKQYQVIFPRYQYFSQKEYYEVREEFFKTVILENEDIAMKKILSRNIKK